MNRRNTLIKAYTTMCAWATMAVIAAVILALTITSCHDDSDLIQDIPSNAESFIEEYWPGYEVSAVQTQKDNACIVKIKNGPTIKFDSSEAWTEILGNGVPLPEILIYDQLPDELYSYLEAIESTKSVYSVDRTSTTYTLTLFDSKISYDIATAKVTYLT